LYVGAVGEIGYLKPTLNGDYIYENLKNKLDTTVNFNNVWQILNYNDTIIFSSSQYLLFYKDLEFIKKIKHLEHSFFSFLVNKRVYTGNFEKGLLYLNKNDDFELAPGGDFFIRKSISFIVPFRNQLLIGTQQNSVFLYDPETGYVKDKVINTYINDFLKTEAVLYGCALLSDNEYYFPTIYGGGIVIDEKGHPLYHLMKKNGLSDDINSYAFQSKYLDNSNANIWLTFNSNISKVEYNSPIRQFDESFGFSGTINDVIFFNGHLFLATFNGTFVRKFDANNYAYFERIPGIGTSWSFDELNLNNKKQLLVGTDRGIYVLDNQFIVTELESLVTNLEPKDKKFIVYKLFVSKLNPNRLFVGGQNNLDILEIENGHWKTVFNFKDDEIKFFAEDAEGNVWYTPIYNGLGKVSFRNNQFEVTKYDTTSGLPGISSNRVFNHYNDILVGTQKGVFRLKDDKFIPDESENVIDYHKNEATIDRFSVDINGNMWFTFSLNEKFNINLFKKFDSENFNVVSKPFDRLPNQTVEVIYNDPNGMTWIGISNQLFSYDQNFEKNYNTTYYTLIRKAIIGEDSVLFNGTFSTLNEKGYRTVSPQQTSDFEYVLDYANNGITFQYVAPYFEKEEDLVYSSYLQGFKDPWSKWSERTERVYTNLDEGDYTFMVKAKNVYGVESEIAKFSFSITPPWYRTILAYVFYVIFALVAVALIVKIYTRRLELEKIRLEGIVAERTAEVVKQKEVIEVQKDEILASIHYARRIQRAVVPSPEKADEVLPEHFLLWLPRDIVSGDFWWMTERDDKVVVVAADSTGHGVPGAFMSMLGVSFLNEIVNKESITTANVILNELRASVKATLKQTGKEGEAKDGMDLALVIIDKKNRKLQYAGAYNPLFIYRNSELIEIKADRNPIGIYVKEKDSFTNNEFDYLPGDTFYIFSDGYVDQFGGEKGEKFKTKNFKELLAQIQHEPMKKQKEILDQNMLEWRGETEQIDDIIILGVRLS